MKQGKLSINSPTIWQDLRKALFSPSLAFITIELDKPAQIQIEPLESVDTRGKYSVEILFNPIGSK